MRLDHLSLSNFRNFARLEQAIPPGATVLVGANAQGKTSLLESIHYLAGASSPHSSSDRELIHFKALADQPPVARVVGQVSGEDGPGRIEIRVILERRSADQEPRLRKEILINGVKRQARQLHGHFLAVLFLPQHLRAIEGPPSERRRLLDDALRQGEPDYAADASEYGRIVTQRNALLKTMRNTRGTERQLRFWDEQLAQLAVKLMRCRGIMLNELQSLADPIHRALTRGRESLHLEYRPAFDPSEPAAKDLDLGSKEPSPARRPDGGVPSAARASLDWSELDPELMASSMLEALQKMRGQEIQRGSTLLGPHRDEVGFSVNEVDLRAYGSRGQNRTAVLALKLAQVEWLQQRKGEYPVLLLDEVLAELDPERRADLLSRIRSAEQAILTTADLEMFGDDFLETAAVWRIEGGQVRSQA